MKRISLAGILALSLLLAAGCRPKPEVPYATYLKDAPAYMPAPGSKNAYDDYVSLGLEAAKTLEEPQTSTFSPGVREVMRNRSLPLLKKLEAASQKPCTFEFRASRPLNTPGPGTGWAKLARALAWTVDGAVAAENWPEAVRWTRVGMTVGFDLNGGGVVDGASGLAMADGVRNAVARGLPKMPADQLEKLSKAVREALLRFPAADVTLVNEHQNELAAIQTLQDAYRSRKAKGLDAISATVYKDAKDSIAYLQAMSEDERPKYFVGLANEVDEGFVLLRASLKMLPKEKQERAQAREADLGKVNYRPWKKLMPHFFEASKPYLDQRTLSLTRSRILVLSALAQGGVKTSGAAPDVLKLIAGDVTIDPYSGRALGYAKAGPDFNVYSVGADGRDDGGDTEDGLHPDIRLLGSLAN